MPIVLFRARVVQEPLPGRCRPPPFFVAPTWGIAVATPLRIARAGLTRVCHQSIVPHLHSLQSPPPPPPVPWLIVVFVAGHVETPVHWQRNVREDMLARRVVTINVWAIHWHVCPSRLLRESAMTYVRVRHARTATFSDVVAPDGGVKRGSDETGSRSIQPFSLCLTVH